MDKRHAHHLWTKLRRVKPWYFLVIFLVSGAICVGALRDNNLHMAKLRQAVYTADQNNGDVETALENLRTYVSAHMNTNLSSGNNAVYPPIQLKYTYQRLVEAAGQQTADSNTNLYNSAQKYCEGQIPTGFSGSYRLDCIEQYVEQHGTATTNIPDGLYKFDFVSPIWSPDLAGWSLVVAALSLLAFIAVVVIDWLIRRLT